MGGYVGNFYEKYGDISIIMISGHGAEIII